MFKILRIWNWKESSACELCGAPEPRSHPEMKGGRSTWADWKAQERPLMVMLLNYFADTLNPFRVFEKQNFSFTSAPREETLFRTKEICLFPLQESQSGGREMATS